MLCIMFYIISYIQSTPVKSDSQGTRKSVRLSEMFDLSEIKNIMQIRYEMQRELNGYRNMELCNNQQHKILYSITLLTKIIIFII